MKLLKKIPSIQFMNYRMHAIVFSAIMILASLLGLMVNGLKWGLDFTGGVLVEVGFEQPVELTPIQQALESLNLEHVQLQHYGSVRDVLVRVPPSEQEEHALSQQIISKIQTVEHSAELKRIEFVGPQVGDELTEQGGLALLAALICILLYVSVRFEWKFALGSVMALIHDVIIVLGVFAWLQIEFDLTVLAALLAVIGYSLNDTIVAYDRIRERFRNSRPGVVSVDVVNHSLNQILARTIMTSLTTLLVLLALFFKGGPMIHGFSIALLAGVIVGTYSSIYVASTAALFLGVKREDLIAKEVEKEGADQSALI